MNSQPSREELAITTYDFLTPEQRLEAVAEILAEAAVKVLSEKYGSGQMPPQSQT